MPSRPSGRLGGAQSSIRVFQPFFVNIDLPTALTRGDEIGIPVVVSNYLDKPQTVSLVLADAPWFERLEETAERSVELNPNEVRAVHFRIRARTVGHHDIQVTARGSERGVADAVRRPIEVVPDGRLVEHVASGTLQRPAEVALAAPKDAIPGQRAGDRQDLPVELQPARRGPRRDLPAALMAASNRPRQRPIPTFWRSTTSAGSARACRRSRPRRGSTFTWAISGF